MKGRKPKGDVLNFSETVAEIAIRSGHPYETVEAVLKAFEDLLYDTIITGKKITLPRVGRLQMKETRRGRPMHGKWSPGITLFCQQTTSAKRYKKKFLEENANSIAKPPATTVPNEG